MYDCVIHLWNIPSVFGKKEERRRILNSIVIAMPLRFVNDGVSLFAVHNIEMTQPTNRTQVKVPRTLSLSLSIYLSRSFSILAVYIGSCSVHHIITDITLCNVAISMARISNFYFFCCIIPLNVHENKLY